MLFAASTPCETVANTYSTYVAQGRARLNRCTHAGTKPYVYVIWYPPSSYLLGETPDTRILHLSSLTPRCLNTITNHLQTLIHLGASHSEDTTVQAKINKTAYLGSILYKRLFLLPGYPITTSTFGRVCSRVSRGSAGKKGTLLVSLLLLLLF